MITVRSAKGADAHEKLDLFRNAEQAKVDIQDTVIRGRGGVDGESV